MSKGLVLAKKYVTLVINDDTLYYFVNLHIEQSTNCQKTNKARRFDTEQLKLDIQYTLYYVED